MTRKEIDRTYGLMGLVLLVVFLISACQTPRPVDTAAALPVISYARDVRNGLCFAFVASNTYYGYEVISFTHVPSEACHD